MNILRRLPLSRLLLICGLVVTIGSAITALALAVGGGPTPPAKPLPEAVHDALAAPSVTGVSARIELTNHLVEGADLASAGGTGAGLASSPLLSGGSGRLWIAGDGKVRLELQAEAGDTQILYDGNTVSLYSPSSNTLYRYTPPRGSDAASSGAGAGGPDATGHRHAVPTVQEIQEGIADLTRHNATISGATPTDVAGQPAYMTRISPSRGGGLIGGAELSWDANNGVPLRTAIYSSTSSSPVIELAVTEISYGAVPDSTFSFTPPAGTKIEEVSPSGEHTGADTGADGSGKSTPQSAGSHPKVTPHGDGLAGIVTIESPVKAGQKDASAAQMEGLPKVDINGRSASELPTALGTLLSFERSGVSYLLVGSVTPSAIEAFARGL